MTENKKDKRLDFGHQCEVMACNYLEDNGYKILETNWRSGHKEIDIIAQKDEMLIIVEVKSRKNEDFINAEDAVNDKKTRNLIRAAHNYILQKNLNCDVRFDIITIILNSPNKYQINHIEDAFFPSINV